MTNKIILSQKVASMEMEDKIDKINSMFIDYSDVDEISIKFVNNNYDLKIAFKKNELFMYLFISEVSNLNISNFGGGLFQMLSLSVRDVSSSQIDRVNFQVLDLEREDISFYCRRMRVVLPNCILEI